MKVISYQRRSEHIRLGNSISEKVNGIYGVPAMYLDSAVFSSKRQLAYVNESQDCLGEQGQLLHRLIRSEPCIFHLGYIHSEGQASMLIDYFEKHGNEFKDIVYNVVITHGSAMLTHSSAVSGVKKLLLFVTTAILNIEQLGILAGFSIESVEDVRGAVNKLFAENNALQFIIVTSYRFSSQKTTRLRFSDDTMQHTGVLFSERGTGVHTVMQTMHFNGDSPYTGKGELFTSFFIAELVSGKSHHDACVASLNNTYHSIVDAQSEKSSELHIVQAPTVSDGFVNVYSV